MKLRYIGRIFYRWVAMLFLFIIAANISSITKLDPSTNIDGLGIIFTVGLVASVISEIE